MLYFAPPHAPHTSPLTRPEPHLKQKLVARQALDRLNQQTVQILRACLRSFFLGLTTDTAHKRERHKQPRAHIRTHTYKYTPKKKSYLNEMSKITVFPQMSEQLGGRREIVDVLLVVGHVRNLHHHTTTQQRPPLPLSPRLVPRRALFDPSTSVCRRSCTCPCACMTRTILTKMAPSLLPLSHWAARASRSAASQPKPEKGTTD